MKAIEIKKGIYWVGAIDWKLRNFHGYLTQRGSTYNAYLITGEKNILVDTVKQLSFRNKKPFFKMDAFQESFYPGTDGYVLLTINLADKLLVAGYIFLKSCNNSYLLGGYHSRFF